MSCSANGNSYMQKISSSKQSDMNREEMKYPVNAKQYCIYTICNSAPTVDTPNGKCCQQHASMYKFEIPSECAICLEDLEPGIMPLLNCGHWFHKECILNYNKLNCPICRTNIKLLNNDYNKWRVKHAKPVNKPICIAGPPLELPATLITVSPNRKKKTSIKYCVSKFDLEYFTNMMNKK